jgi:hypothetical protein
MVHSMLLDARMGNKFWAKALNTSIHIHNQMPSKSISNQSPYELLHSNTPDISKLQLFGCHAFACAALHQA